MDGDIQSSKILLNNSVFPIFRKANEVGADQILEERIYKTESMATPVTLHIP